MHILDRITRLILVFTILPISEAMSWDKIVDGGLSLHIAEFATVPNQVNGEPPKLNNMAFAEGRLFVVDSHGGKIYDITNGVTTLWFDVADALNGLLLQSGVEAGVRAIAFHPNFSTNRKFYTSQQEVRPADFQNYDYLSDAVRPIARQSSYSRVSSDMI